MHLMKVNAQEQLAVLLGGVQASDGHQQLIIVAAGDLRNPCPGHVLAPRA